MSETKSKKITVFKYIKRHPIPSRYNWWLKKMYTNEDLRLESQWKTELEKNKVI